MVTGISEGSLYIDVDTDSHSVISLEEDSDVAREYFLSTGMISSLYESTVWEEITGLESVSTISILAKASEENIDILLLSRANLSTEIEKLNTDETTKQSIMNAVNSGMMVTVPAEEVTMGDWSGTGYIVTNPATGVGEYMISGGLNGGAVAVIAAIPMILASFASVLAAAVLIAALMQFLAAIIITPFLFGAGVILLALVFVATVELNRLMWTDYMDYIFTGNFESYEEACHEASRLGFISLNEVSIARFFHNIYYYLDLAIKNPSSETFVLGETGSYNVFARDNKYTYFELPKEKWNELVRLFNGNYDGVWEINKMYIDGQIAADKTILLTNDPYKLYLLNSGKPRFYQRELNYLTELDYRFEKVGENLWKAVKN